MTCIQVEKADGISDKDDKLLNTKATTFLLTGSLSERYELLQSLALIASKSRMNSLKITKAFRIILRIHRLLNSKEIGKPSVNF
jgi:hypothetical protein